VREELQNTDLWTVVRGPVLWGRASRSRAGELWHAMRRFSHEVGHWVRRAPVTFAKVEHLAESIAALQTNGSGVDGTTDAQAPIFLLSTGWRTGSTLLQRILVTDPHLFLWGEPLGEKTLVSRVTEMVNCSLSPPDLKWRTRPLPDNLTSSSLATSWIATLSPSVTISDWHFEVSLIDGSVIRLAGSVLAAGG
jgi:hypothetical protein